MEKTISCAECGVEVIYNEKEGFPRKYCFPCSAKKKASFDDMATSVKVEKVDFDRTISEDSIVVVKPKANGNGYLRMDMSYAKDIFVEIYDKTKPDDMEIDMGNAIALVKQAKEGLQ